MVKQKFRFNKTSRKNAVDTFKSLERNALVGSLVAAATTDALLAAVIGLAVFLVCRLVVVFISGIEDVSEEGDEPQMPPGGKRPVSRKRSSVREDGDDAA